MASAPGGSSSTGGRNWPLIVALLAAFALVFAVLPNPFRIPSDEPTTAAEFAPVPGKKEQSTQSGSFASVGFAEGAGFGAPPPPPPPPPPPIDPKTGDPRTAPSQFSCVMIDGEPHQTNDPLSPPCVPTYDPKLKGSNAPGVTDNEIRVVLYGEPGSSPDTGTDLNTEYRSSEEPRCTVAFQCTNLVRTLKAHLRYHNERYQTYGRVVHVITHQASCSTSCTEAQRRGDALTILRDYDPFAVVYLGDHAGAFWDEMAKAKRAVFGVNFSVDAEVYEENKPYVWSFMPDMQLETATSAGYICRKLVGGDVRFTRDVTLKGTKRELGLVYEIDPDGDIKPDVAAAELRRQLKAQCGFDFHKDNIANYNSDDQSSTADVTAQIIAKMQLNDVTTIVCYCLPGAAVSSMQNAATQNGYFPEWYWDQASAMDRVIWQDVYWDKNQANFGSTYFWRQPAFREQHHYKAYLKEEPNTTPNERFSFRTYYFFQNLFSGIQGAGPYLAVNWTEKGMFTFTERKNKNYPWVPYGGFGTGGPSPYTFIETSEGFWRDPQGTPPGGKRGAGCMRVIQAGERFGAGDWTRGDDDLASFEAMLTGNRAAIDERTDPCTEDIYRIEDAQAGDGI